MATEMAFARRLQRRHLLRRCFPRRMRAAQRPASDYTLGRCGHAARALSTSAVATRAVRDRGWPSSLQRGVYGAIDLSLYLVEKFCGREIALKCAKALLLSMPRSSQSGYSALPLSRPHFDDRIKRAEQYSQRHFVRTVSIEDLADRVGMGPRNFYPALQGSDRKSSRRLHANVARIGCQRNAGARCCIYTDGLHEDGIRGSRVFRSVFKRHTGMTPAEYRSTFARMTSDPGDHAR